MLIDTHLAVLLTLLRTSARSVESYISPNPFNANPDFSLQHIYLGLRRLVDMAAHHIYQV